MIEDIYEKQGIECCFCVKIHIGISGLKLNYDVDSAGKLFLCTRNRTEIWHMVSENQRGE